MERKELGRIRKAAFGWGGYDDAMIGVSFDLGGESWGVGDFKGTWGLERSEYAKWTEEDRIRTLGETCLFVRDILKASGKKNVADLVGTPVEVTFDGNLLKSWRVLTEVLP